MFHFCGRCFVVLLFAKLLSLRWRNSYKLLLWTATERKKELPGLVTGLLKLAVFNPHRVRGVAYLV